MTVLVKLLVTRAGNVPTDTLLDATVTAAMLAADLSALDMPLPGRRAEPTADGAVR